MKDKLTEIGNKLNKNSPQHSTIQQLEQEIKGIRKKMEDDKPNKDKPKEVPKPKDGPPNSDDLISTIWKWSSSDKSGYQLFESDKSNGFKVYITKDHPLLKGKKLDNLDGIFPFSIRFNKENSSRQEGDKNFYFDKDNSNLELGAFDEWPDEPNDKIEIEVVFNGEGLRPNGEDYCCFAFASKCR